MSKSKTRSRSGRGALLTIGALFLISGMLRFLDGTGSAIAKEVEAFTSADSESIGAEAKHRAPDECISEDGFNAIMARLRERRSALDERERAIDLRASEVEEAEVALQQNLNALVEAEEALSATISQADGAAERDIGALVAVYERMKPKDVANVFEAMDPGFAAGFLGRMRTEAAASVMAGLSSEKAYTISVLLAGRNMNVPAE